MKRPFAKAHRALVTLLLCVTLVGCGTVTVDEYRGAQPAFVLEAFFSGQLQAHGFLKDRSGRVTRRFSADILAYWRDGVGTLEEDFLFDDGEQSRRVWTLTPDGAGRYIGTAGDVVGEGVATVAGNSMFLDYVLRVPYGDGTIDLRVDDRMYLIDDAVLLNESGLYKFGVRVGNLVLVIRKLDNRANTVAAS